jgi:hypothetical protein
MPAQRYFLIFVLCFTALHHGSVLACTCPKQTVQEKFAASKHVFLARVTRIEEIKTPLNVLWPTGTRGFFEVTESFKGDSTTISSVQTGHGGGDCGVPLAIGGMYLFFANDQGTIDLCSGSTRFDDKTAALLRGYRNSRERGVNEKSPNPSLQTDRFPAAELTR